MRNKEMHHGRFAMFAALGIIAADLATGNTHFSSLEHEGTLRQL